jgi:hypothetical protein
MRQAVIERAPSTGSNIETILDQCRATADAFNNRQVTAGGASRANRLISIDEIGSTDPLAGLKDAAFSSVKNINKNSGNKVSKAERSAGKLKRNGVLALVSTLGLTAFFGGVAGAEPHSSQASGSEDTPTGSAADQELADALTPSGFVNENACVNIVEAQSPDMVFTTTDADGNTVSVISQDVRLTHPVGTGPNALRWSDAVSTPFAGDNPRQMERDLFRNLCTDPAFLAETAAGLADVEVDGVRLADTNEWLQRHLGPASRIDDIAEGYAPLFGETGTPTDAELLEAVEGNVQAQADAARVIALIRHMQRNGLVHTRSGLSVHVKEFGMDIDGGIPEFETISPYDGEFLTYVVSSKTDGCVAVIGFNRYDKRFTVVGCDQPVPEQPGTPSNPSNPHNPITPPAHRRPPTGTPPPPGEEPPCVPGDDECPIEEPPCVPGDDECPIEEPPCVPGDDECPIEEPPCVPGDDECPIEEPPRPEVPVPAPDPITGPGAGGNADNNNDPTDDPGYVDDPDPVDPEVPVEQPVDQAPDEEPVIPPQDPSTDPGDPANFPG